MVPSPALFCRFEQSRGCQGYSGWQHSSVLRVDETLG